MKAPPECLQCGYPLLRGYDVTPNPDTGYPPCLNPICPVRPTCPHCGGQQIHMPIGGAGRALLSCYDCGLPFDASDQARR